MHEYNICYGLDSNYTEQLSVSLVSILKNSKKDEKFNVYILDGGLSKEDKQNISELKEIKDFGLNFVRVNPKDFKDCPLLKNTNKEFDFYHVTLPTYFRFKLPSLLPNVDKILYLDCDVLARTSFEELYNADVKKYAVAMISDVESEKEAKRLNIKKYYNAGVMLINLDYWRKNDIEKKLFDYAMKNKKTILWQDQDIINVVLQKEIKEVDLKWNYSYFLYDKINEEDLKKSAIIHFAGRFKPWANPIDHPLFDFYYYYLLLTPFKTRVLDYKLNIKGKYLKDNIGGGVTNILIKSSDVDLNEKTKEIYEYTDKAVKDKGVHLSIETDKKLKNIFSDIKEIYLYSDKIVKDSEFVQRTQTDEKISAVYDEITKNYDYTKEEIIKSQDKQRIETDKKISAVYDEITKNYDYTNNEIIKNSKEIKSEMNNTISDKISWFEKFLNEKLQEKTYNFYGEIEKICRETDVVNKENKKIFEYKIQELKKYADTDIIDRASSLTDCKINGVYDEISKNYDFTKELVNELSENTKKNINLLDELIKKSNEELNKKVWDIEQTNERNESYVNSVNDCLNNKIDYLAVNTDKKTELLKSDIEKIKDENNAAINSLNEIIKQKNDDFNKLLAEKETLFNEELNKISDEQKKHEEAQKETEIKLEQNRIELYTYIDNQNAEKSRETDNKVQSVRDFFADELEKFEQSQNSKIRETVTGFNCETAKLYSDMEKNINIVNERINNTQNDVYSKYSENKYNIETIKNEYVSKTLYENERNVAEAKYLQAEEENNEKIRKVISDCEIMLNEQRKKYEKKLMKLEEKLEFIENQYQNRNFFTRMFNKYMKR